MRRATRWEAATAGLLLLLSTIPTVLAVIGAHNCPYECSGNGICSMDDSMTCTCLAQWANASPICDRRESLSRCLPDSDATSTVSTLLHMLLHWLYECRTVSYGKRLV